MDAGGTRKPPGETEGQTGGRTDCEARARPVEGYDNGQPASLAELEREKQEEDDV